MQSPKLSEDSKAKTKIGLDAVLLTCSEVGEEAQLLVGGSNEAAKPPFLHPQPLQILLRFSFFKLLELCLDLHSQSFACVPLMLSRHQCSLQTLHAHGRAEQQQMPCLVWAVLCMLCSALL